MQKGKGRKARAKSARLTKAFFFEAKAGLITTVASGNGGVKAAHAAMKTRVCGGWTDRATVPGGLTTTALLLTTMQLLRMALTADGSSSPVHAASCAVCARTLSSTFHLSSTTCVAGAECAPTRPAVDCQGCSSARCNRRSRCGIRRAHVASAPSAAGPRPMAASKLSLFSTRLSRLMKCLSPVRHPPSASCLVFVLPQCRSTTTADRRSLFNTSSLVLRYHEPHISLHCPIIISQEGRSAIPSFSFVKFHTYLLHRISHTVGTFINLQ